jgi:hypothetical protein
MNIDVNWLAIILAVIAFMALGFLWYSPILFGKPWMKLKGYTKESIKKEQAQMGKWYLVSTIVAIITAFVLSHVISLSMHYYTYTPVMTGITSAFWMWLGFVMPTQVTATIFGDKKWKLFGIDTGYQLVGLLVMGVILGLLA